MRRLILLLLGGVASLSSRALAGSQARAGIYGTYSNLARSKESGDLNGYELTLVAQSSSASVVFECSQGAPSKTVFVPVKLTGNRISFRVNEKDNACDGEYLGVFVAGGLRLHSEVVGDTEFIPRRTSYWIASMPPPSKYERVWSPLFDGLAIGCPAKNLEEMAPADLDLQIEDFVLLLPPAQNKMIEAQAKIECKNSIAGVGCGNFAFLEVAEKVGFLRRFINALCGSDLVCTGQSVCGPVGR